MTVGIEQMYGSDFITPSRPLTLLTATHKRGYSPARWVGMIYQAVWGGGAA